ncbi:uncharacterized protein Z518_04379 [Rhinocladiella mackenziei CBS 650.93]|uniref:Aminotransferase class I/classII large domain-containing protein n=1 Tax=Rhinocladiella mackenziei CBS 650.93 TaxID=1442369 RepID=A0A0D2H7N3_9EURO|nr:uncharacterized protein Z518_04379 [Rhinocladiella mackenziei CBS 650.93]KIX06403.1 hypothetical protein Z518_04379 [Rhinocladiella mackenziei CBS 650.93]
MPAPSSLIDLTDLVCWNSLILSQWHNSRPSNSPRQWINARSKDAQYVLGGSASPSLSIDKLISLSNDPAKTEDALQFRSLDLHLGSPQGSLNLRSTIAGLYEERKGEKILPEHVITAIGTTGANLTVFQSFLHPGDHVVCAYPIYSQLLEFPRVLKCEVSLWKLDPENQWKLDLEELRRLIRPSTKMIILNNPNNPTGSHMDAQMQGQILDIARGKDIIVFTDEIFRPLFYHDGEVPPSFVEHEYSKVIVTGSMSKVWGMSGVRIGWIVCKDRVLLDVLLNAREYTLQATSSIDEVIAAEDLSDRCRPIILKRHRGYGKENVQLLDAFIKKNSDVCSWTKPTCGGTGFIKFHSEDGSPQQELEFCQTLLKETGVLLSPGGLCFSAAGCTDFQGYVRIHLTALPDNMQKALALLDEFVDARRRISS